MERIFLGFSSRFVGLGLTLCGFGLILSMRFKTSSRVTVLPVDGSDKVNIPNNVRVGITQLTAIPTRLSDSSAPPSNRVIRSPVLEGNGAGPAKETRSPLLALGGGPDYLGDQQTARWGTPAGRLSFRIDFTNGEVCTPYAHPHTGSTRLLPSW